MGKGEVIATVALLGSIVIALAMLLWTWQLGAHRRANVALTKGEE